ncbi:hypothetical protein BKA63DRAFT_495669 [Paraphoma chrysanthemicola]|nr:hypothetical protein BKA63DRAFT_495669 [Paraphoma chrysanthemicola]
MQLKFTLLAAALSASVASEFVIVTIPRPQIDIFNIQSQISSLQNFVTSRIGQLTASLPASEISRAASAQQALASFVATATYDIPDKVTQIGAIETFTSGVPSWYSALPSDLKSYYDQNNARVQSVVNEAFAVSSSPTGTAGAARSTGVAQREKVVQYVGVAGAAAFAGVMAL